MNLPPMRFTSTVSCSQKWKNQQTMHQEYKDILIYTSISLYILWHTLLHYRVFWHLNFVPQRMFLMLNMKTTNFYSNFIQIHRIELFQVKNSTFLTTHSENLYILVYFSIHWYILWHAVTHSPLLWIRLATPTGLCDTPFPFHSLLALSCRAAVCSMVSPRRGFPRPNCHIHNLTSWIMLPRLPSAAAASGQPNRNLESWGLLNKSTTSFIVESRCAPQKPATPFNTVIYVVLHSIYKYMIV